ncbi:hypothetical protein [Actinomadura sp. WMMB 499]|uniref:hypothetical protein n=1 Tax=Actinomadura sp. WMMB 499 TaxID=1219491 RepID=UPI00124512B3|nr:hypothetical protein [Actinomadura sp. WMMB 499]QFG26016.1 hypothetical protein F7P10_37625 [Actinomadura sp. WMMB 499]
MTGTMRIPRSRGALSGTLLVLAGLWGGLLPFAGPYAGFGFAPDEPWVYSDARLQLSVAPAVAAGVGGLIVLASANRAFALTGAWVAALGGAWFAVGRDVAALWDAGGVGAPLGTSEGRRLAEDLAGFTGLGIVVVFLAALALGRFAVVGVREAAPAEPPAEPSGPAPSGPARPDGGERTTQPLVFGRYARENGPPGDRPVAGDRGPEPY